MLAFVIATDPSVSLRRSSGKRVLHDLRSVREDVLCSRVLSGDSGRAATWKEQGSLGYKSLQSTGASSASYW